MLRRGRKKHLLAKVKNACFRIGIFDFVSRIYSIAFKDALNNHLGYLATNMKLT